MRFYEKCCMVVIIFVCSLRCLFWIYSDGDWEEKIFTAIKEWENAANFMNTRQYLNMKNFDEENYILTNDMCERHVNKTDILGLILVTSYVGNIANRNSYRVGISDERLRKMGLLRIFVLGRIPKTEHFMTQRRVMDEQEMFEDLLQGNFEDNYRNNSLKSIMGLHWASRRCAKAIFIIKMNDDVIHDVVQLQEYLHDYRIQNPLLTYSADLLVGMMRTREKPLREPHWKRYVSAQEYPSDFYPDYLKGHLYITNPQTVQRLVEKAIMVPLFWIDDIWITGILRERAKLHLFSIKRHFMARRIEDIKTCIRDLHDYNLKCGYVYYYGSFEPHLQTDFQLMSFKCMGNESDCLERTLGNLLKVKTKKILK